MIKLGTLEKMLRNSLVFKPKKVKISFEVQQTLPYGSPSINKILRDFYEALAQAIFAGRTRNRHEEEHDIEPDLTDYKRNRYIEVKCAGHTRRIMLKDEQIKKYHRLQLLDFPIERPRIYFSMFRYAVRGIQKRVDGFNENQAIGFLAQNTSYMIGLPFSVIYYIHQNGPELSELYTRCETENSNPVTNFSTKAIDLFFSEPERALKDVYLSPKDFVIRRVKTSRRISINSYPLNQFPITLIKDNDNYHQQFIERLRKEKENKVSF